MRRKNFDLVINFYSGGSSPIITKLSGAKWRLGFDHSAKLRWANNIVVPKPDFSGNWLRAFGKLLEPLGINSKDIRYRPFYYCSEADLAFAKDYVKAFDKPFVIFNLGASEARKFWSAQQHAALANWLYQQYGFIPLVLTNPGQEYLVESFKQHAPAELPVHYVPVLSFGKLAALFKFAKFLVSGDTGLMHLAFAVEAPVLAIFTSTRPEYVTPEGLTYVFCFKPGPEQYRDEFNKVLGSQPDYVSVQAAAKELIARLDKTKFA
jgi:ADP-heptose:LPS heptosyltransferase